MPRWRQLEDIEDVPSPEDRAASLLTAFVFAVHGAFEEALASGEQPLSLAAAAILNTVHALPGIQPIELSLAVGVTAPASGRLSNQLVRRGLIARARHSHDRRASVLQLTRDGERQRRAASLRCRELTQGLVKRIPKYWLPRMIKILELLLPVLTPDARRALAACRHCDWGACRLNDATPCPVTDAAFLRRATAEAEAEIERSRPLWQQALPPEERPPPPPVEIAFRRPGSPRSIGELMLNLAVEEATLGPRQGRRRRW